MSLSMFYLPIREYDAPNSKDCINVFFYFDFISISTILTSRTILFPDSPLVTIEYFVPQLVVITSKQRPRKLTIHGSDGNDHAFLLKGHEDLRQDERVMQVSASTKCPFLY
jgi:hypothetical protein